MEKEDRRQVEKEELLSKFIVRDDIIEISGSEEFVSRQVELLKDSIMIRLENPLVGKSQANAVSSKVLFLDPSNQNPNTDIIEYVAKNESQKLLGSPSFENVFVITNNDISIIADVPGGSTAQKMVNLILIYLLAKLQINIEEVSFKELRDMCEKYGEVDKPNFSKIVNSNRKFFLVNGGAKGQSVRLIRPGIKVAEKLISDLNSKQ